MKRITVQISDEHAILLAARLAEDQLSRRQLVTELIHLYVSGRFRWQRNGLVAGEGRKLAPPEWYPEAPDAWRDEHGNIDLDVAFAARRESATRTPKLWTVRDVARWCEVRYGIRLDPNTIRRYAAEHYEPPRVSAGGRNSWRWDEDADDLRELIADVGAGRVQEWSRGVIAEGRRQSKAARRKVQKGWEVDISWGEDSS